MSTPPVLFRCEIEMRGDKTTVRCHGRVVNETAHELRDIVKPLIPKYRIIVLDLTDITYVDSSGLGTLTGLKVSAALDAYCRLEFVNLSPRVQELLHITKLTSFFKSLRGESRQPTTAEKREVKPEAFSVGTTTPDGRATESDDTTTQSKPVVEEKKDRDAGPFSVEVKETDREEIESDVTITLSGPLADQAADHEADSRSIGVERADQEKIVPEVAIESSATAAAVSRKSVPRKKAAKMLPTQTPKKAVRKPAKKPVEKAARRKENKRKASLPPRHSRDS